jgi:P-type conjugative transfer protein TrbJ
VTQIANNLQLIQSYQQQVAGYVRQGLQLQAELKNLINNPTSLLGPEVGQMINTMGSIMREGQAIGYNLAEINRNFARAYKNPTAKNFQKLFTSWHETSTDTIQSALRGIGMIRDMFPSNEAALQALYNHSQSTNGTLDSLQTLAQINIKNIQQLQTLQELMANQAAVEATFMATQTAKDQKQLDDATALAAPYTTPIPAEKTAPAPKWGK